jgi:hypothetical protein
VPGGLRYALARALLDVDVPPFDSLDDFSETLARYERGPREQAVRRVLDRLHGRRALVPVAIVERRRRLPSTELRRALREADARLYLQKVAAAESLVVVPAPASAPRSMRRAAAFIAAGLLMVAVGEFADRMPNPVTRTATAEPRTVNLEPRTENIEPRTQNVAPRAANPESRIPNPEHRTPNPAVKRVVRPAHAAVQRARPHKASRGIFDRLRLRWLRNAFTSL